MKTSKVKKLLSRLALSLCLLGLAPRPAAAWGSKAHRIIALVAERLVDAEVKRQVGDLLRGGSLVSVAAWADNPSQNPEYRATSSWHFVDIPLNGRYSAERDCPNGNCLIGAIESQQRILANGSLSWDERGKALKYIVHLVGDAHQPLHCAQNEGDRGGNTVKVTFYGRATTLHKIWDSDLVDRVKYSESTYASRLLRLAVKERAMGAEGGNALAWVQESHNLASYAYKLPGTGNLGDSYYTSALPIVDRQLAKAGLRLARILKESLR